MLPLILFLALCPALRAQAINVMPLLKGIETRYNSTQTLQVNFVETYTARGRKRVEKGVLTLRKPGRMRWQYTEPAGKLFVSDGQFIYAYYPDDHRAEKMKFKETDDMRAPLAFLLGKLNFQQDFREFRASRQGADAWIVAIPKSDKLPYTEVSFLATPDFVIRKLSVKGQDNSTVEFDLEGERRNPAVAEGEFRFSPPAGTEYIDASKQ